VKLGHITALKRLIQNRISAYPEEREDVDVFMNRADHNGNTPLMLSAQLGRFAMTNVLLEAGAKTYFLNPNKQNAVDLARINGHEKVAALIEKYQPGRR
jgi:ankyrin repeat protein